MGRIIAFSLINIFHFVLISSGLAQEKVELTIQSASKPLPFAHAWSTTDRTGTVSDMDGRAVITPKSFPLEVVLSLVGYADTTLQFTRGGKFVVEMREEAYQLDQVVVGASLRQEKRIDAPTLVSILDLASMERAQAVSLAEGLVYQPGLRVETNCQNCGYSQVRVNGLEGAYSQILVNGRPTFSAVNSVYGLDQLPVAMIERVEVVRGASSALNGSNAIAGAINVITKDPSEPELEVFNRSGLIGGDALDNNLSLYGAGTDSTGKVGVAVFGNIRNRDHHDRDGDGFSELTELASQSVGLMTVFKPTNLKRLSIDMRLLDERRRGGSDFDVLPHEARVSEAIESNVIGAGLTYEQFSQNLKNKWAFYVSGQQTEMQNYYGAGRDPRGYGSTGGSTVVGGLQYQRQLSKKGVQLVGGIEQLFESMYDRKPGYGLNLEQEVSRSSAYLHIDQRVSNRLKWNAGVRGDLDNLVDRILVNPRLGLKYKFAPTWNLRLGAAQGYRSPQLISSEMHSTLVAGEVQVIRPADNLLAERSYSGSASLQKEIKTNNGQIELVAETFITRLTNPFILEEIDLEGVMVLEKRNGVGASIYGVNLEANASLKNWNWSSGLTYNRGRFDEPVYWSSEGTENNPTDEYLRSPNWYGYFNGEYNTHDWSISAQWIYTGPMWVTHFAGYVESDELVRTGCFNDIGMSIKRTIDLPQHNHLDIELGVKNILDAYQTDLDRGPDRDASYVYGPTMPRMVFVGLRLEM